MSKFNTRPALPEEFELFFATEYKNRIGHLRADFDSTGKVFFHTWWEGPAKNHNTESFKMDFDNLIKPLRNEYLKDLFVMQKYCYKHTELEITGGYTQMYGIIAESEDYLCAIRMTPVLGDYQLYVFAYKKNREQ